MLLRSKGWTAVVLLSLALGIGANSAIFSAVNGLLLKQIPVKDPDTLVRLKWSGRNDMVNSSSDYGFSAAGPDGQNVRSTFSAVVCSTSSLNWSKYPRPANSTMSAGKRERLVGRMNTSPTPPENMRRCMKSVTAPSKRESM